MSASSGRHVSRTGCRAPATTRRRTSTRAEAAPRQVLSVPSPKGAAQMPSGGLRAGLSRIAVS